MKYQNEFLFDDEERKDDLVPDDKEKESEEKENGDENKEKGFFKSGCILRGRILCRIIYKISSFFHRRNASFTCGRRNLQMP